MSVELCEGCGSAASLSYLRAAGPASCCPERLMVPAESWRLRALEAEAKLNTPELLDFSAGVVMEAAHQRERWGADHDVGKTAWDWFWLIGFLAQKAATAHLAGDADKALHHTISTAAACANWHAAIAGADNRMRPGIDPAARSLTAEASA